MCTTQTGAAAVWRALTPASACATKAWVWVLDDPRAADVFVLPGWWFWTTTLAAAAIWPVEGGL
jgi:hypothetical protein